MNFKILYILYFALVISVLFTIGATVINKDFIEGVKAGRSIADSTYNDNLYSSWLGYMIPNNVKVKSNSNSSITFGELSKSTSLVKIDASTIDVSVINCAPLPKQFHYYYFIETASSFLGFGLVIYLLVLLYKLFRRIQKSLRAREVFSMGVVRVLKSLGIVLIALEIWSTVFYYFHCKAAQIVLTQYGYEVDHYIEIEYITIIFGIALLLVSEFLKIGYKIQEEQSLTV